MGFFDSIFGHNSSDPGWLKGGVRSAIDKYNAYLLQMYSPQAVRGRVGNFSGNYDTSMNQMQQAGNAAYGERGIRGTPQTALRRSSDIGNFADQAQMQAYQGLMQGQQGLMDMYNQGRPWFHRDASGGLVGKLNDAAAAYGQYAAAGAAAGAQTGGTTSANNPYGPMTPTTGEVAPPTYEGSGQGAWQGGTTQPVDPYGQSYQQYAAMGGAGGPGMAGWNPAQYNPQYQFLKRRMGRFQ